jgi:hypothetical protein
VQIWMDHDPGVIYPDGTCLDAAEILDPERPPWSNRVVRLTSVKVQVILTRARRRSSAAPLRFLSTPVSRPSPPPADLEREETW